MLRVTDDKKDEIQKSCNSYLEKEFLKIRVLASLIGTLTATFPGNKLGPLQYRALYKCKTYTLKKSKGNFECRVTLSKDALLDLKWWRDNIIFVSKSLQYPPISKVIYTDVSNIGRGASCEGMSTGGPWHLNEKQLHANAFELKVIPLGLKPFIKEEKIHIKVFSDSTTAIGYINKIATSHSDTCYHIWEWAEKKGIHITAAYIPGNKSIEADRESKELSVDLEWTVCLKSLLKALVFLNYTPKVDLIQFYTYYSYKPDPEASGVD